MRAFARIVVPLGAAAIMACSQISPAAPTNLSDADRKTVETPFDVPADVQGEDGRVVRITSGQLTVLGNPYMRTLELKGTAGMRLAANFEEAAFFAADDCQPCVPGDSVDLDATLSGLSLRGTLTFRGKTHRLGMGVYDASAHLLFTGEPVVLPPFTPDGTVTLEAPFQMGGTVTPGSEPAMIATRYDVSGQGVATLTFDKRFAAPDLPVWFITSVVFDFTH
jgi:hypothetical protein